MFMMYIYGALALGAVFIYGWGSGIIENYNDMTGRIAKYEHAAELTIARDAAHADQLKRRDDAIAASKCAAQIKNFIKNPDLLVKPDPFKNDGGG